MKSKLFILVILFMLVGASSVSAQYEKLTHMSTNVFLDSAPASDCAAKLFKYKVDEDVNFGGFINITSDEVGAKVRVLLLNEYNYEIFKHHSRDESYDEIFRVDIFEINGTVFWNATYNLNMGGVACFVYWYMEPTSRNAGHVDIYLEMWDYEYYQPPVTTTTSIVTNTTTTTTTTTSSTTSGTTEEPENIFLTYLLLGVLGGIGVVILYAKFCPRKVKYVWGVK